MAIMMLEIMESLKIPVAEPETNRTIMISIAKIDPDKPIDMGEEEDEEDDA
jgi:hypothetical protein